MRAILGMGALLSLALGSISTEAVAADPEQEVEKILKKVPLVDGHNDVPWAVRKRAEGDVSALLELLSGLRRAALQAAGRPGGAARRAHLRHQAGLLVYGGGY